MPFLSLNPTKIHVWLSLSLSLSTFGVKLFVSPSVSLCILNLRFSLSLPPPPLLLHHCSTSTGCRQKKKKKKTKNQAEHCWEKIQISDENEWVLKLTFRSFFSGIKSQLSSMVVGHFPPMPNKMFFCRSWVIISDFPLGSNGDLGTTHSSPHEVIPLSLSFWPNEILGFSCLIKWNVLP